MVSDLHAHTAYSFCGRDLPSVVIQTAIENGIDCLGITDHNYGIGERKREYRERMVYLKEKFSSQIILLCGIEIATLPHLYDIVNTEIAEYDYCLLEHVDKPDSIANKKFFGFCDGLPIPVGIAHTDLFAYAQQCNMAPETFFKEMANRNMFWEMNVNYDSIHGYREHAYVKEFFKNERQQKIIKEAGVMLSVGFDGHRVEDYRGDRVKETCIFLEQNGFRTADTYLIKKSIDT